MIVGVVNHNSYSGSEQYLTQLDTSIISLLENKIIPDVIIGPDYGLVTKDAMQENRPNTMQERQDVLKKLKSLSKKIPQTFLISGSMFWYQKNKEENDYAFSSVPVYKNGSLIDEFHKERDVTEGVSAKLYGEKIGRKAIYKRGDSAKNFMNINGKSVAIEICADHGNQNVKGVDLELILAFDNKGGFYINQCNDSWSRYAVMCNGYTGDDLAQYYSTETKFQNIESMNISNLTDVIRLYDLSLLKNTKNKS